MAFGFVFLGFQVENHEIYFCLVFRHWLYQMSRWKRHRRKIVPLIFGENVPDNFRWIFGKTIRPKKFLSETPCQAQHQ
ncbi:Protein CBG13800 [Caenorhabditis briggsae]|uniref:Protein CBG13800 n=1 Tax=Caenorhabditis briggsae TaxID=6238 RepID=E3CU48_CAEBR|nr:Protein CBG13800 [Caenorhabditis briggsae]CBX32988.1 Protein CBG13800 [Caenorhabditis briggsae]